MQTFYGVPARKLRKEFRGDLPPETKLVLTVVTEAEVSARLEEGFKRMQADHDRRTQTGQVDGPVA